ncbi:MAG TPA: hypothetical protein VGQ28_10050 [Thermoanaerobaculia bacterium]|jgi:hypothetical protein|nr:hypothetical protein [Thermoanaerobaculia bacterium]
MNADKHPDSDRLGQVLRQGDPAAHEPGLTADEIRTMRRAVLTAAPEPRRQRAWFPLVATGAAALLALALAVAFGPWHRPPVSRSPIQVAAIPTPAAAPSVPPAAASSATPSQPQAPVKISRPARRHPVHAPKTSPVRPDDAPMLVASLPVREIQFSTPGGTRVIWELSTEEVR